MQLDWCAPIEFATNYAGYENMVFLHSSLTHHEYGKLSILAVDMAEETTDSWQSLEQLTTTKETAWNDRLFGFIGYELGQQSNNKPSTIKLPNIWFARFKSVFVFNNKAKTLHLYGTRPEPKPAKLDTAPIVKSLHSNMSKTSYLQNIENTLKQIAAGEFYQANITRKFYGEFTETISTFSLFKKLCSLSPAPYSAYIRAHGVDILSSSPECFLTVNEDGGVESRPIKGTAPLSSAAEELANSEKDCAENLMIVDLMRNDLSRQCDAGSVKTHRLFEVTSYATLHHMASTITGQRKASSSNIDVIRTCLPPGSMTGAPKKAVMEWCSQIEQMQRGIYSGAIGWLTESGGADLSVVIRTLIIENNKFEFQVGGGIVADSEPLKEWQETITKAKAIADCLGIDKTELEQI